MENRLFSDLAWLPRLSSDFTAQCRAARESAEPGNALRALAQHALDENQLDRLAKTVAKLRDSKTSLKPLVPFRLGILSNSTLDFIVPSLIGTALRYGIELECIKADYDQVIQEALSPASKVNQSKPDAVLVAIDYRSLPLQASFRNADDAKTAVSAAVEYIQQIRAGLKQNTGAVCIFQTFAAPPERLFGSLDRMLPGTFRNMLDRVNSALADLLLGSGDVLLDVAGLAETVGLAAWHDPTQWNMAKLPFSNAFLPLYSEHVARVLGALRGKSRKCLVLDLDNTVWGGVIGDDGLEGIQIAQGDGTGEAHLAVQKLALDLRSRGIVLAVSSKNNDEVARRPFREHPEMLLKEEHIAVFQANWNDKATNIAAIAAELSLGIDSMVLLDDNPVERNLVRQFSPQVAVPELPDDPALYARTLSAAGYFESVAFGHEDMNRADFYRDNARRVALQNQAGDLDAYLASLDMQITFQPFDATGRARIAQLINKSNQFNLTTRRYTEAEVAQLERESGVFTLQIRLSDAFGDNGMISVIICRPKPYAVWEIDTWLMSCRVLGRGVEQMVLAEILDRAKAEGIRTLKGIYSPSGRNQMVETHYQKLGFTQTATLEDGSTLWELAVDAARVSRPPMKVISVGFDAVKA